MCIPKAAKPFFTWSILANDTLSRWAMDTPSRLSTSPSCLIDSSMDSKYCSSAAIRCCKVAGEYCRSPIISDKWGEIQWKPNKIHDTRKAYFLFEPQNIVQRTYIPYYHIIITFSATIINCMISISSMIYITTESVVLIYKTFVCCITVKLNLANS